MKMKILTWNISYAYGLGSEGIGYHQQDLAHFEDSLNSMSELIRSQNCDVVLLQEVDFDSKRSHHQNQLDFLARKTGLSYRNEVISWNRPYVPYPGLNPANHFGKVVSGGGILSRFPITPVMQDLLPKPKENLALYNYFYLNRYLQMAAIQWDENNPENKLTVMNLHLEAFSKENRELHLVKMQDRLKDYQIDLAGGDFNGDVQLSNEIASSFLAVPGAGPTFPCDGPKDVLDHFVVNRSRIQDAKVTTLNTGSVSDHFPVLLEFSLKP